MSVDGYRDYQRREFCKDVKCPWQVELEAEAAGSPGYEVIRARCKNQCRYTTYQFHHWLIDKGFLVIKAQ